MSAVVMENVVKTFANVVAVDDLSLEVPYGCIYGFIGPNGSGKTTTLRMIMRILHPDRGTITVLGERNGTAADDRVAYLPEERGLYKKMKVRDVLRFHAALKGMRDSKAAIASWLERLGLADWANQKVEALSKGMAQKVQFIAAVIADPQLVLLDEPLTGLDPVNTDVLREAMLELKRKGTTVIFSTHDMATAERMCDFIFMIYKGKKVLDGPLEAIQARFGEDTVRVRLDRGVELASLPHVVKVSDYGRWLELRLDRDGDPQELLQALMQRGKVLHFEVTRPSLHQIFVQIAGPEAEGEDIVVARS
ncbi:MAG: putative ABC transporter ATP-binding protein YhaQ [Gemmatales bacterium]|nr:MAG: putative ABC transporter ATP-binding protein YhaQ [Gemmatales bacterium]